MQLLIGLGANLGDPPRAFNQALVALSERHKVLAVSRRYRSEPEGPPQPRYWNMAALIEVAVPMMVLLDECQQLETAAGRERDPARRWQPRPLDLDLLIAGSLVHQGPRLILPHPHLVRRAFALVPAAELAPEWVHPLAHSTLAELCKQLQSAAATGVEPA
jgi:2-amino-4-hydroxy-6-hydroxymethyldihydropteridine diphosphokinase